MAKKKYFGTDGIRGRSGIEPITPDFILRLGYAAGKILAAEKNTLTERCVVLIGKDTRLSGYMLEAALEAGFSAAGVDVMLCGPLPTPGVAYLTRALRLSAGVVISASHNTYQDNGIKFFSARGDKFSDAFELKVEKLLDEKLVCVAPENLGRARRLDDAAGRYIEFCKSTFPNDINLRGLTIVVDCAHGAAYHIAEHVFHEMGAEVICIGNQPNGLNINDGFGATAPSALQQTVLEKKADLGLALDGDADRIKIVDHKGVLYNGDQLLYILVQRRLASGQSIPGVVGTLMTNKAIESALQKQGIPFIRAEVGDRHVLQELKKRQWLLGGESSGHLLCLDKQNTGDGIVSALQILAAMRYSGQTLEQLLNGLHLYPQVCVDVAIPDGYSWQDDAVLCTKVAKMEKALGEKGRVLVRTSGTEALLRIMVEAETKEHAQICAEQLAERFAPTLELHLAYMG